MAAAQLSEAVDLTQISCETYSSRSGNLIVGRQRRWQMRKQLPTTSKLEIAEVQGCGSADDQRHVSGSRFEFLSRDNRLKCVVASLEIKIRQLCCHRHDVCVFAQQPLRDELLNSAEIRKYPRPCERADRNRKGLRVPVWECTLPSSLCNSLRLRDKTLLALRCDWRIGAKLKDRQRCSAGARNPITSRRLRR